MRPRRNPGGRRATHFAVVGEDVMENWMYASGKVICRAMQKPTTAHILYANGAAWTPDTPQQGRCYDDIRTRVAVTAISPNCVGCALLGIRQR
jgi:hypothetical protein